MKAQWQNEKQAIQEISDLKERLEQARGEAGGGPRRESRSAACRRAPLTARIPELEKKLAEHESSEGDREGQAPAVPEGRRWTPTTSPRSSPAGRAFPSAACSRVENGEADPHGGRGCNERVVGQDEAIEAVATAPQTPRAQGPAGPGPPQSEPSCSSARPALGKTEPRPCAGRIHVSTHRTRWCASTCPSTWRKHSVSRLVGRAPRAMSATKRAAS